MFQPHHRFAECKALRKNIRKLHEASLAPSSLIDAHNVYHYSLFQKLNSGKYHMEELERVIENTAPQETFDPLSTFGFKVNLHIDGYFYSCGSAMDILAREVLTYFAIPLPSKVYFTTAHDQINSVRPGDSLLPFLLKPDWKEEFSNYRNALTHEVLVGTMYDIKVSLVGGQMARKIVFPLPDDPRAAPSALTYRNNPNVVDYCKKNFKRILSLCNTVYGQINRRVNTLGRLPL